MLVIMVFVKKMNMITALGFLFLYFCYILMVVAQSTRTGQTPADIEAAEFVNEMENLRKKPCSIAN